MIVWMPMFYILFNVAWSESLGSESIRNPSSLL
jgi:hypothetical protein